MALSPNFAGTWNIDPSHSQLGFMVRHAMVTKTRGQFTDYTGSFTIDPENVNNAANVVIQATSIDTGNADRDGHVRTGDFFEVEVRRSPRRHRRQGHGRQRGVTGDLTIKCATKSIDLAEFEGTNVDAYDLSASAQRHRLHQPQEFGADWQARRTRRHGFDKVVLRSGLRRQGVVSS